MTPPPALTSPLISVGDLVDAMTQVYQDGSKKTLAYEPFIYWVRRMYPIEDET